MPISCALARAKLMDVVAGLRKAGLREKTTTAIKAGYVTSIVTPLRAVTGNASWGSFVHLARDPIASAIDVAQSYARSAGTGFKVKPHELRDFTHALDRDGLGVMAKGFGKGTAPVRDAYNESRSVSEFVNKLRLNLQANPSVPNSTVEYQRVKYDSPLAQTMTDASFSILEAADRPWWQMAFDTSLYRQGKLYAIREGLKGDALSRRSSELMASPTLEMQMRALADANYATFKDKNVLSNTASAIKRGIRSRADVEIKPGLSDFERQSQQSVKVASKVGDYVAETTLPFTGVPSSVAGKMVSVSPLGLLNPDIFVGSQGMRSAALANAAIGTGMIGVGMLLYQKGMLTGAAPTNPTEKAQWKKAGKASYSVLIDGYWVGLKSLGPVASPLFMGAAMRRGFDEGQSTGEAVGMGAKASAKFLTQQTYLQQIGNMVDLMQGGGSFAQTATSMAVPAPAFIGQLNRAVDPYTRDNRAFVDQLKSKLPLGPLYAPTPREMGPTGPLLERSILERLSSVVSPFPVTKDRDTPDLKQIRELQVSFGVPPRTVQGTINGKKRIATIPRDVWEKFTKEAGTEAMTEITQKLHDPEFIRLDDDQKKKELDKIVSRARDKYRKPIKDKLMPTAVPRHITRR